MALCRDQSYIRTGAALWGKEQPYRTRSALTGPGVSIRDQQLLYGTRSCCMVLYRDRSYIHPRAAPQDQEQLYGTRSLCMNSFVGPGASVWDWELL